ncbi:hypothetical protein TSAR_015405, partial [Trichomalopsis sarcophagae]
IESICERTRRRDSDDDVVCDRDYNVGTYDNGRSSTCASVLPEVPSLYDPLQAPWAYYYAQMIQGQGLPERELGSHRSSARKSKKNPRRQLTKEDYFSRQLSPPRSITSPPGSTRRRTNQEKIPWDDFRSERKRRVEEDRATTRSQFPIKRRGTLVGDLQPVPINPLVDPPPFSCFNCWQEGHRMRQCPRPVTRSYCRNCGKNGEDEGRALAAVELRERRSRDSSRAHHSRQRCQEDPRGRSRSNISVESQRNRGEETLSCNRGRRRETASSRVEESHEADQLRRHELQLREQLFAQPLPGLNIASSLQEQIAPPFLGQPAPSK